MIRLFTTFYLDKNEERRKENEYCIRKNVACEAIDEIVFLTEGTSVDFVESTKIKEIPITSRPSFQDIFQVVEQMTDNEDINIIANTDIYFDEQLEMLYHMNLENTFLALTRWDVQADYSLKFCNEYFSQDTWIIKGKLKDSVSLDYFMGQPGCDNRFAYELENAGYKLLNPSYSLMTYHVHASMHRPYLEAKTPNYVEGPYAYILPNTLDVGWKKWAFLLRNRAILKLYRAIRHKYYLNIWKGHLPKKKITLTMKCKAFFLKYWYHPRIL